MKFEIYRGRNGKWFWRLKAKNHEIIANGQGYSKKADCLHVIRLIKRTTKGDIVDLVEEEKKAVRDAAVAKRKAKTTKKKTAKKKIAKRKTAKRKAPKRKTAKRKAPKRKTAKRKSSSRRR